MNNARLFLSGEIDVLDLGGGIILSRERTKRNADLWHFSDGEKDVKQMWVKRSKESMEKDRKDFQTGGREPYTMHMDRAYQELMKRETAGDLMKQFGFVSMVQYFTEYGTGRIVNRRTKKSMTGAEIAKKVGIALPTFKKLVRDMKANGIIEHRADGYYISRRLIKKGRGNVQPIHGQGTERTAGESDGDC